MLTTLSDGTPPLQKRGIRRHARKGAIAVAGGTTVVVGIILIPLPGPGSLVILAGLSILGREFPRARRTADRAHGAVRAGTEKARRTLSTRRSQKGDD